MGLEAHDDVTRGFSEQTLRYFVTAEHVFTILFSVELDVNHVMSVSPHEVRKAPYARCLALLCRVSSRRWWDS